MKKMAIVPWGKEFMADALFDLQSDMNRDNSFMMWVQTREYFLSNGWDVHTIDYYDDVADVELFVFFCFSEEWYELIYRKHLEDRTLYIAFEPPVVDVKHSKEGIELLKRFFKVVLSWNDDVVDNKRVFKFMYPYYFNKSNKRTNFYEKKLLVNLSGNKESNEENELYSERKRIIKFFDASNEFELYGPGWNKNEYVSYKGMAENKVEVYSKFKFALCLENMKNIKGYVTEKILDCFCSGIVPVYLGASNIDEYIPPDTYIHYEQFDDLFELKEKLKGVTEQEYNQYLQAADKYLSSDMKKIFLPETFAANINNIYASMISFKYEATGNWRLYKMKIMLKKICNKLKKKHIDKSRNKGIFVVGENSKIDKNTVIGNYTYVGRNCSITKASIGRYVSIGNNVSIGPGEHQLDRISTSSYLYESDVDWYDELTNKSVIIKNDVWIGTDSIIKRGVTVGNGAVIGANSFVNKDVPDFAVVAGNPARVIKYRLNENIRKAILKEEWWNLPLDEAKKAIKVIEKMS